MFDDRLYLYGSYDLFGSGFCSDRYHVVSAPLTDLTDWTDHGVSFTVDDVPWSDAVLYAPDALCYNGRYYLFFCLSDGTEGVAESDNPAGPFKNARQITLNGKPISGIDPSVLEDNGHIYYTWGQFHLNAGELNDDLCSLIPASVHTNVLSNEPGREGFHEGSSLRKIGSRYCMIYASEYKEDHPNSGSRPTKLDYAVSDSPFGPYTRRGTVIDNEGCDPLSWNNHGSVIKVDGEWFVFYHASSDHSVYSRRARAERLQVDENTGMIDQTIPTTNGFLRTLRPEHITSPVNSCRFFGGAYVTQTNDGRFPCVGLRSGAGFAFSQVLFAESAYFLTIRYRSNEKALLRICLDDRNAGEAILRDCDYLSFSSLRISANRGFAVLRFEIIESSDTIACEIDSLEFHAYL